MKHAVKIVLFFLLICVSATLPVSADGEQRLLEQAEAAFKSGNELLQTDPDAAKAAYLRSVEYYNSILESGIKNSGLYYNIANAWLRLEQTGHAVLNYRKALLYAPNDSRIRYNLEYARTLQKNGFEIKTENEILHILFFWHFMLPFFWKVIILLAANAVFWGALILGRFGRPLRGTAIAALVISIVIIASSVIDLRSMDELHGVVIAESTIGRLGDSRSYESAFDAPLYQGVEFDVEQRRVGWILAELPNGELVWLEESDCGIVEE